MSVSTRRKILLNVIDTLKSITIANGFDTDVEYVSENLLIPTELKITQFPALFAIDADEIYGVDNGMDSKLEIVINGYIRNSEDKNALLDSFIADVMKAMLTDRTRGCLATDTNILGTTTDKGTDKKFGYFEMRFVVKYLHPNNFFFKNN